MTEHGCKGLDINCPLCEARMHQDKATGELVAGLDLWYPRVEKNVDAIQVGLMDVRSSDDIRISYDFDRDGWVIKQASTFCWSSDDKSCDEDWQEVAFIRAWARKRWEGIDDPRHGDLVTTPYGVGEILQFTGGPGFQNDLYNYKSSMTTGCVVRVNATPDPIDYEFRIEELTPGPTGHG